ncbi:hypothetical protein A3709_19935 [Halioglobus sp. HI00S01]|uniref:hypothetical protein n=1 Tax=Halioglobus sp. HI00S01 TaxID=1822214 RepID=UPI0007C2AEF3|nr:hypothetical protein [Halioglobus sp. HI00S01]KZX57896.1 hypothetical protein A3709_19935 [Halioglobus sp. HI00S01]
MTKRYMTAVFEYDEGAELPRLITEAFSSETMAFHDAKVTAVSMEDEITRVEKLEQLEQQIED